MDDEWFPSRPVLRPGLRVVRRHDGRHQVGHRPDQRVVLPDRPDAGAFLADLAAGRRPALDSPGPRAWARALVDRGLVLEADLVARVHRLGPPRAASAAALARSGSSAVERLGSRARTRVAVTADDEWRAGCRELLEAAGLPAAGPRTPPTVMLVVTATGEPPRDALDAPMRAGLPHLLVTNVAGVVTVGPFVAPGLTACLRCVDAHGSDRDPGHGVVVEQHRPTPGEPCDPLLMRLALAWAVRDLASYVEGDLPATWSATVRVDAALAPERQAWTRHPRCGCSWGDGLAVG